MKRFISVLAFVLLFATVFSKSVFAQTQSATTTPQTNNVQQQVVQYPINTNPDVPQNFSTYTQSVVLELLSAFSCQLSGINPLNPQGQCLGPDPKTGKLGFVDNKGGAIGFLTDSINMTFQIPVSSGQYISAISSQFGIAKPAMAQMGGFGFNALTPILDLWAAIRNIVYIFFVLIFVFIGVGIMFRLHIDPRTVMTIQNSLPKIVVGLVLVTLSYAIAGFLVDMMYVSLYLTHNTIAGVSTSQGIKNLTPQAIQGQNPPGAVGASTEGSYGLSSLVSGATGGVVTVIKDATGLGDKGAPTAGISSIPTVGGFFNSIFSNIPIVGGLLNLSGATTGTSYSIVQTLISTVSFIVGTYAGIQVGQIQQVQIAGTGIGGIPAALLAGGVTAALTETILKEFLPNLIGFLIILGIVITALLRLWFTLIKAYLYILIYIVLAPFFIAFGLIPGEHTSVGFKPWLKTVIANLAVFPVTYGLILFSQLIVEKLKGSGGFVPPLIGTSDPSAFGSIFAVGVLLAIPEILNMVKGALKVQEGKVGQGISGAIGIGTGLTKAAVDPISKRLIAHKDPMTGNLEAGYLPRKLGGMIKNTADTLSTSPRVGGVANKISNNPFVKGIVQQGREAIAMPKQQKEIANEKAQQQRDIDAQERETMARRANLSKVTLTGTLDNHIHESIEDAAAANGKNKQQIALMKKKGKLQGFIEERAQNAPAGSPARESALAAVKRMQQIKDDLVAVAKHYNPTATSTMDNQELANIIRAGGGVASLMPTEPIESRLNMDANNLITAIIDDANAFSMITKEDLQKIADANHAPTTPTMSKEEILNEIVEHGHEKIITKKEPETIIDENSS